MHQIQWDASGTVTSSQASGATHGTRWQVLSDNVQRSRMSASSQRLEALRAAGLSRYVRRYPVISSAAWSPCDTHTVTHSRSHTIGLCAAGVVSFCFTTSPRAPALEGVQHDTRTHRQNAAQTNRKTTTHAPQRNYIASTRSIEGVVETTAPSLSCYNPFARRNLNNSSTIF